MSGPQVNGPSTGGKYIDSIGEWHLLELHYLEA